MYASLTSIAMFGCSYIYFMQGLEIASECTRKHLRTPKIPKVSWGSMPPDPLTSGGPRRPIRFALFPGLHTQLLLLEATTRCPGYSTGLMVAVLLIFFFPIWPCLVI